MVEYMNCVINFEEYREFLEISSSLLETLSNEIEQAKSEIYTENNSEITKEDIIIDLKENWEMLDNKERFIFIQQFIKKS